MENIKRKQVEKYHKAPAGKKEEIECNPYTIFHQALENCKPVVGLTSIQKGGKYYQVSDVMYYVYNKMLFFLIINYIVWFTILPRFPSPLQTIDGASLP